MYVFKFRDSGEIWELDDDQFRVKSGYWFRAILKEMKWFRNYYRECCHDISVSLFFHDGDLIGAVTVSDSEVSFNDFSNRQDKECVIERSVRNG